MSTQQPLFTLLSQTYDLPETGSPSTIIQVLEFLPRVVLRSPVHSNPFPFLARPE